MLRSYFKIAFRTFFNHKMYAAINIGGLAVGLACAILIALWVRDETSYDRFHQDNDRIYRVNWDYKWNNNEGIGSGTPPPLAAAMVDGIPGVLAATRVYPVARQIVRYGDKFFSESRIFGLDPNFFEIFDFKLVAGNPETALSEPNSAILTEAIARKYFGDTQALLGRIVTIGNDKEMFGTLYQSTFKVTGIVENPPPNSHFQFDILTSMASHPPVAYFDWSWVWMQVTTYAKLAEGATASTIEAAMPALVERFAPSAFRRIGFSYSELIESGGRWDFVLQPLTDLYLGSAQSGNRLGPLGNRAYVYIFSLIAIFIVFMACINFTNLATARASQRAKEVGVRKVLGSKRTMFICQFLTESTLFACLALPVALLLVELFLPMFNSLAGKALQFNLFDPLWLGPGLVLLAIVVGLLAGSYPGFYLSSLSTIRVLNGAGSTRANKPHLRNALVVFQFAITIGVVASTLLVQNQLRFIRQADLGFDRDGLVIISNEDNRLGNQAEAFRERLRSNAGIIDASISTGVPPHWGFEDYYKVEGKGEEQFDLISYMTDENFISTLGIEIIEGRGFAREFGAEAQSVVLNEAAVQSFGWDDPIGKTIRYPSRGDYQVIGVMKDFNFMSLYSPITPFALFHHSSQSYQIPSSYIVVRIPPGSVDRSLAVLEAEWKRIAPGAPFEYSFLDDAFEKQYQGDRRLGTIFFAFSVLTIFIACLGLLGLAAFAAEQRTKEIGIRKVLGATVTNVLMLLSKDFVKIVLLANVLAWPVVGYVMHRWLQSFAYHTEMSWWVFVLAGTLALVIALATVGTQAIKVALVNPVDSLKYE